MPGINEGGADIVAANNLTGKVQIKREQSSNRVARRQVISVRSVIVNAVVFDGARQTSWQRLPTDMLFNEFARSHQSYQIAHQFFGALARKA